MPALSTMTSFSDCATFLTVALESIESRVKARETSCMICGADPVDCAATGSPLMMAINAKLRGVILRVSSTMRLPISAWMATTTRLNDMCPTRREPAVAGPGAVGIARSLIRFWIASWYRRWQESPACLRMNATVSRNVLWVPIVRIVSSLAFFMKSWRAASSMV